MSSTIIPCQACSCMLPCSEFLSAFIAVCMLLSLIPAITLNVKAVSYSDPVYSRVGTPEVAIFNVYTGASDDFFKSQMVNHFYNAVAAGKFKKSDKE